MPKIYIAAPWISRADMPNIAASVERLGYEITHKWWEVEDVLETERTSSQLEDQAMRDVGGVSSADVLLVINSNKSEGKAVEQGIAIALRKPIIIVGNRGEFSQNVFHYLDSFYTWVDNVGTALLLLKFYVKTTA